jgi:branched-chain amino acid transport system substrate-binding protein
VNKHLSRLAQVSLALASLALVSQALAQIPPKTRIAVAVPLSGPLTLNGEEVRQGAELAAEMINAKGGILGKSKVELTPLDTRCNPTEAVNVTQRAISSGIDLYVGNYCSSAALATMPVLAAEGIPQIVLAYAPSITGTARTPNSVRIGPSAGLQMAPLAKYAVTVDKTRKFAALATNDDFGRSMAEAFADSVKKLGGEVQDIQYYKFGADFSTYLTKIKNMGVDGMLFIGLGNDTINFTKGYNELGLKMRIYGGDNFSDAQYIQKQSPKPQNLVFAWVYDDDSKRSPDVAPQPANIKAFVEAFKAKFGKIPSRNNVWGFATVEVFRQAVERVGSLDRKAVAAQLHSGTAFGTPFGEISFAACGQSNNKNGVGKFEGETTFFLKDKNWGDDVVPLLCPAS